MQCKRKLRAFLLWGSSTFPTWVILMILYFTLMILCLMFTHYTQHCETYRHVSNYTFRYPRASYPVSVRTCLLPVVKAIWAWLTLSELHYLSSDQWLISKLKSISKTQKMCFRATVQCFDSVECWAQQTHSHTNELSREGRGWRTTLSCSRFPVIPLIDSQRL